ncbi:MAG: cyclic nucleotide-binding domain-containing protein [Mariprofundaceae bacterium]
MSSHKEKFISSVLQFDWKFLVKLFLSGLFTAIGIYQHMGAEKLELALAALIFVPILGIVFTYMKRDMSEQAVRMTIIILATIFVLVTSELSIFLALAFFMMLDGATQKDSIKQDSAFRWLNAVEVANKPEDIVQIFSKHRLFTSIPKKSCEKLIAECRYLNIAEGSKFIRQGEENTNLFFIAKGHVRVVRENEILAELRQGDIVGEVSVSGLSMPVADVIAEDNVTLFAVSFKQMNELAKTYPEFGVRLHRLSKTRRAELATRSKIEISPAIINQFISRHQLFKVLPQHLQRYLADECKVYALKKGGLLIRQGEFNSSLYLVAKGFINVVKDGEHVASLGEGDVVGEISSAGISMPVADVVADSDVIAYAFPSEQITRVAQKSSQFSEKLSEIGMLRSQAKAEE